MISQPDIKVYLYSVSSIIYMILYRGTLSYLDALSKLMEAESSNSAMHDIDESLKAQAHELAKYQDRCKELEMEVLTLQASNWQSAMSSKVRSLV
jgi:hypothetical protein